MLDVKEGDVLVIGSAEYPIKYVGDWAGGLALTPSFRRQARLSASTKRSPAISGGKRGAPATHLTGLKCTPLDPASKEVKQRAALNTPHEVLQTFLADNTGYVQVAVEELKV